MASTSSSGRREQERDPFLVLEPPNKNIKSSLSAKQFDVFINHRGPDVKTTLALELYNSLQRAGIRAYLDSEETELGDSISSTIKNAIFSSAVHIAIFSPRYAESAWCLAELALMFQTKARIIPLFYHVHPSDFRHIKNGVADAFSKHEEKGRYPDHDIQKWKECLQNVSGIKGYELNGQDDDLNKLCNGVVSAVIKENQKRKFSLQVAKYAVGLDELVKDFHSNCQRNGQMIDKIIGIFGMGGSGKTTLAKDLFNRKHSEFSGSTFQFDVREEHGKGELTSLQNKLLNDLCQSRTDHKFSSIEEGTAYIKDYLEKSRELRFLIVIDDVDHQMQLDALLPTDALNPNSLVIVTTRDERLLIQAGVRVRYKMKEMNADHSRELFCWHAFHRRSCRSGFENLVDSFVQECGGLPLAVQVLGAHVFGSNKGYWKLQLDEVKARLHRDIKLTLKISYDALEEDQKQIFMDVACFFTGSRVSTAISIWKASEWRAEHALQTLKDKCLIEVNISVDHMETGLTEPRYFLRMHAHLRDLGREMADNEMNPCRLWRPKDLIGMQEIKVFQDILTGSQGKNFRCFNYIRVNQKDLTMTYFLESSKTSTDLQWLDLQSHFDYEYIPKWIPLQNLQTLILEGVSPLRLWQRDDQAPLKLKELYCNFERLHFAEDVFLRDFDELMSWFGMFKHLESLHLEWNIDWNINWNIEWNIEWNWLLKSVRELTSLKTLMLASFKVEEELALSNREETTDYRFRMRSLEAITLYSIFNTRKISISGQLCPSLTSLKLYYMVHLIEVNLTGVTTLERLVLVDCRRLRKVLVNDLLQLEMVRIKSCSMESLPNFGHLSSLKRIYISHCFKLQNISAIERLKGLKRVWIAHCPQLQNIKAVEPLKGLKRIWIEGCTMLQGIIGFKELKKLRRIFIGNCPVLENIEGIEFLICLESIIITACPKLRNIRGIEELKGLKEMILSDTPIISCVERLQRLPWELTILVGKSAMSDLNADNIGEILTMADGFCEIECEQQVKEMIHSFHQTQQSLSTFIFCATLEGMPRISQHVYVGNSNVRIKGYANLWHHRGKWTYMCVVNEEMLSKYNSWMPLQYRCDIRKAFIMGVKEGSERKTLHILQRLFAQLCEDEYDDLEAYLQNYLLNADSSFTDFEQCDDYDDYAEYVDFDEEYDSGNDDYDDYNDDDYDDEAEDYDDKDEEDGGGFVVSHYYFNTYDDEDEENDGGKDNYNDDDD